MDTRPGARDRLSACLLAFGPWLLLYFFVQALGRPRHPLLVALPFERSWPVLEWTEILYASGYLFTPLAPLLTPTRAGLRQFVATGLLATLVVGVLWLSIPVVAVPRSFVPETVWGRLLAAERSWSAHVAAFPSFHALWALIAADALGLRSRRWAAFAWSWAALITLSCATTGQHALVDLVAAAALFPPLRRAGEALARRLGAPDRSTLRLHKWYLDCTTQDGHAAIVYRGRITLLGFTVPYFELLVVGPGGSRRWRRLSSRPRIRPEGAGFQLEAPSIGLRGRWEPTTAAFTVTLLESPGRTIRWRCEQASGLSELQLPDGRRLAGLGYAEQLEMSLEPWALPFKELRWGRFIGSGRSVVWIDWRGGLERRWLFVDGVPTEAMRIEVDGVSWSTGSLDIESGVVLRDGIIGRTLAGLFAPLVPRSLGRAIETKWLCLARLRVGEAKVQGSVIHEWVRWA